MDPAAIREKYGVTPREMIEVKALMGDPSDNIPGVPGIGEKGALALIQKYHTIEYIYAHLEELELTPALRKKLAEGRESAALSRELGTICCEVPVPQWSELKPRPRQEDALYAFLSRLELNRLITRLGLAAPETMPEEPAAEEAAPAVTFAPLTEESDLAAWGKETPIILRPAGRRMVRLPPSASFAGSSYAAARIPLPPCGRKFSLCPIPKSPPTPNPIIKRR